MASSSQLYLLADHIKLSLLERQRAISLDLEPTSQDGHISRSLDSMREGVEALEQEEARLREGGDSSVLSQIKFRSANVDFSAVSNFQTSKLKHPTSDLSMTIWHLNFVASQPRQFPRPYRSPTTTLSNLTSHLLGGLISIAHPLLSSSAPVPLPRMPQSLFVSGITHTQQNTTKNAPMTWHFSLIVMSQRGLQIRQGWIINRYMNITKMYYKIRMNNWTV